MGEKKGWERPEFPKGSRVFITIIMIIVIITTIINIIIVIIILIIIYSRCFSCFLGVFAYFELIFLWGIVGTVLVISGVFCSVRDFGDRELGS